MTFLELIRLLQRGEPVEEAVLKDVPSIEIWETAEVCMRSPYDINSEIKFLDPELVHTAPVFEGDDESTDYGRMLMIEFLMNTVKALAKSSPDVDSITLAKRIIEYKINDA